MRLLLSEIFQKVSNAKTKDEKVAILRNNNSDALRKLLIWNYDESITSALPPGEVPYTPNEAPSGTEHTKLEHESRILHHFVKGGSNLAQTKREMMFIQLLEGLHKSEAEILCLVKDKALQTKYRITLNVVKEAFPQIQWGSRT